jgi:hypothetical protein
MPFRPERHEREAKLKRKLELMPEIYEKAGIPTISEKVEKIMVPTDMLKEIYGVLDDEDIVGEDRIKYLNFARIIFRLKQKYKGTALKNQSERELRAYMERKRGLREDVLRKVMNKVIEYPTTPTAGAGVAPAGT